MRLKTILAAVAFALAVGSAGAASAETIRIGVTPGPHAEILEQVKPIAHAKGLDIEIVEFSDYVVPNAALDTGELDANSFQHEPYLVNEIDKRGYKLSKVANTVTFPIGIYSRKIKAIGELRDGARVGIPNDPTNGGRVLLLLQSAGLLKLADGVGLKPTVLDITGNPKNLQIIELDAAQLPRSLDDTDISAINTNYAVEAGLDPGKDAILREAADSPYVNIIAVQTARKDEPWVKTLVESYHTDAIKQFLAERFKGAVVAGW
ncbi:MetQ/NlpA family ABC transporter substrate-binding protein [Inquilinus limosus]|uniref:Metal ABC transporter substrate-binding protein n=1 Tax=Inquilinus limosus TaxID=171674 RepID=A0A211Z0P1_9PROT|nr:MetQ/NlpA family ABC transporter substrate-binding protein [Inquilinus limosus]OWJ58687.1 metal ABC transporter substrate-binding protein [Inquilinus limosus]